MEAGIVNFAIYENGSEYLGMADVTMPTRTNKKLTANGAGIAGDVDIPVVGHRDAMTVSIKFTDITRDTYKLREMRRHIIDLRAAHEEYDKTSGKIVVHAYKHVMEVLPLTATDGTVAPAAGQGASGEYSVLSIKDYVDGKLVGDVDPLNYKDVDSSGTDLLAEVRAALGK